MSLAKAGAESKNPASLEAGQKLDQRKHQRDPAPFYTQEAISMTKPEDPKFEDFLELYNKLNDQSKREILDIAHYHIWRAMGEAEYPCRIIRGAWLNFRHEIKMLFKRGKP